MSEYMEICDVQSCGKHAYGNLLKCYEHQVEYAKENQRLDWLPSTDWDDCADMGELSL